MGMATTTGARVLVIDDDEVALMTLERILLKQGFGVHTMVSPIGATRVVRDQGIAVVVCDLNMPAMQGDAFARLFRRTRLFKDVGLILVSAAPEDELERLSDEGVADAVVHKSAVERELVPTVRRLVVRSTRPPA